MRTQKDKVINYITRKGVITTRDATNDLWIMDLQGVIRDLKENGYTIYDIWVKSKESRYKVYAFKRKELIKYKLKMTMGII